MRRLAYFVVGIVLIAAAAGLSHSLITGRDLFLLAALAPAILAAFAFGALLLVRVVRGD